MTRSALVGSSIFLLSSQVGELGGAAVSTLLLAQSLSRSGYRVTLFVTLPPGPDVSAELKTLGAKVVCPYFNKGWKFGWPTIQLAWRLKLFALREKPACIISMGLTAEALYALRCRVPNLHLWENTEALPNIKFVDSRFPKYLTRAAGLIAPSSTVEANIRSTYRWHGPIRRLPFWCGKPDPAGRRARSVARHFLYWGRLDPDKGLLQLVSAFKQLASTHPEARLTIAGAGAFPALEEAVKDSPTICFRGHVCRSRYEELLASVDVCVLPSLHESYGLVLLEACARSIPVIATRVGSIPELFEGRRAALLVPPNDVPALTEALASLLDENSSKYQNRCADARQTYHELANLESIDRQVRALIEEIGLSAMAQSR